MYLGLSAKPIISFEKPTTQISKVPNIGVFSRKPGFSIFLDAVVGYDSLSIIMNQNVAGKNLNSKSIYKKKFIIDSCSIYGGGFEKLIIKIYFSGTNSGVVYLVGKPVYDNVKRRIEVQNINFDIKSKNVLLGSADWILIKNYQRNK